MDDIKIVDQVLKVLKPKLFRGYYSPIPILSKKCSYSMSIGGRDDGKTTAWLIVIMYAWQEYGYASVWMRRMAEALKPQFMAELFEKAFSEGLLPNHKKKYDGIAYKSRTFYGYWLNKDNKKIYDEPFCYTYALSVGENAKSAYDKKTLAFIVFDEFMSRDIYLGNEFVIFTNAISTIIRNHLEASVIMLGNTVSKDCIYFKELGLTNIWTQPQDTIDVYTYGNSNTTLALEYCGVKQSNKKKTAINDRFFAFDNPSLEMIRTGGWEIAMYPHPPKREPDDVLLYKKAYIEYLGEVVQLEVRKADSIGFYVLVHPEEDTEDAEVVYSDKMVWDKRYRHHIDKKIKIDFVLFSLYFQKKWYYSDNTIGETVRSFFQNYLKLQTNEK